MNLPGGHQQNFILSEPNARSSPAFIAPAIGSAADALAVAKQIAVIEATRRHRPKTLELMQKCIARYSR